MTVLVTNENENGYTGEYKEIEYLDAHFRVKCRLCTVLDAVGI